MAIDVDKARTAKMLLDTPLIQEVFDDIEQAAFNEAVNAKPADNETRAAKCAEVRAIRALRMRLALLVAEEQAERGAKSRDWPDRAGPNTL